MNHKEAHFLHRLLATFIDAAIGFAINLYVINIVVKSVSIPELVSNLFLFLLILLSPFGLLYQILLTQWFGGTLGKLLTGIKITSAEGTHLSFKRIMFRQTIGYMFSSLLFGFGYLAILKNDKRQAWHDQAVGSLVVKTGNFWIIGLLVWIGMLGALGYFGAQTVKAALTNEPLKQSFLQLYKNYQESREPGGLEIYSVPKAKITLNGENKGETPLKNAEIEPGEYTVKLTTEEANTTSWEGTITVKKGITTLLSRDLNTSVLAGEVITLEPGKGVYITSEPSGATVSIDDKEVGKTPYTNEETFIGEHQIVLEKPGSGSRVIKMNVLSEYQTHLNMELGKEQAVKATNQNQTAPKQTATPKPVTAQEKQDAINYWQSELTYLNQEATNLPQYKGTDKDQSKINRMIAIVNEQKAFASKALTKSQNDETFTEAEANQARKYAQLTEEYNSLLNEVFPNR
jgi:uncharacterized RDD family membrane protein YckC